MTRKLFLIALIVLISIPSAIFPVSTNAGRKDKVILWTRYLGKDNDFGYRKPLIDSKNKSLYVSSPFKVICFDLFSGEIKWERKFQTNALPFVNDYVALNDKKIFFGNREGLYCLSSDTGNIIWDSKIKVSSNIEVAANTIYLASKNSIYRIDSRTGKTISILNVPDKNNYNFITFVDKNRVVASTAHGMKKLVDLVKRTVVWENNKDNNELVDKPIICGKYLVVSGYLVKFERLVIFELETGIIVKSVWQSQVQMDSSDGRILTSDFCYSTDTLKPLWKTESGFSRFFDCFDSVFFWYFDSYKICDWDGNTIAIKYRVSEKIRNSNHFFDDVWTKPASYDGRYFLLTSNGFLVSYANKPEAITYYSGNDYITADGKQIKLEHKPIQSEDGRLMVDPRGFLEPLGWISSHDDDYTTKWMVFHDYEKQIAIAIPNSGLYTHDIDKIIPAIKTDNGILMIPLETMVTEFGLTMTKDGDRIKLSYPSK